MLWQELIMSVPWRAYAGVSLCKNRIKFITAFVYFVEYIHFLKSLFSIMEVFLCISATALASCSHGLFSSSENQAEAEVLPLCCCCSRGSKRWEIKEANVVSEWRVGYQQLPDIVGPCFICRPAGWPVARQHQQVFPSCPQPHPSASSTSSILLCSEEALKIIIWAVGWPMGENISAPADLGAGFFKMPLPWHNNLDKCLSI